LSPEEDIASTRMRRLRQAAGVLRERAARYGAGLTDPDEATGERWDLGQVLSHVAEFIPFWLAEVEKIIGAGGEGVAFGRVKSTPSRLARIEAGRHEPPQDLLARVEQGLNDVEAVLARYGEPEMAMVGTHQTKGRMTVAEAIDEFLVDHLEQHARQLETREV
jgi:transcriptional regulator with XRE-family HTH domain